MFTIAVAKIRRTAAVIARTRSVTVGAIARELAVDECRLWHFITRMNGLREELGLPARKSRLIDAYQEAAQCLRAQNMSITRIALANTMGKKPSAVRAYLCRHPERITELGIVRAYRTRSPEPKTVHTDRTRSRERLQTTREKRRLQKIALRFMLDRTRQQMSLV